MPLLDTDATGIARCWWCAGHADYTAYHDHEWGRPVVDDQRLFEKICLEGFQSGLSWLTILRKRENFRAAFRDFDFRTLARFNQRSVTRLLGDEGIVRHRGKIESAINNARRAIELVDEAGSLAAFVWRFQPSQHPVFDGRRSESPESRQLSKELKRRGWSFIGPTTAYAFMQSMGIVNDHVPGCHVHNAMAAVRRPDF